MGFTVCLRLRVTGWQLGMSDGVSAEEEGLDRFVVYIAVGSTEMQHHCLFESFPTFLVSLRQMPSHICSFDPRSLYMMSQPVKSGDQTDRRASTAFLCFISRAQSIKEKHTAYTRTLLQLKSPWVHEYQLQAIVS